MLIIENSKLSEYYFGMRFANLNTMLCKHVKILYIKQ